MSLTGTLQNHIRASRDPDQSLVFEPDYLMYHYTSGSANAPTTYTLNVPASPDSPVVIENVEHFIVTAFSDTPTIAVGDGSTANAWIATSSITPATKGTGFRSTANPQYKEAASRIVATVSATLGGEGLIIAKLLHLKTA